MRGAYCGSVLGFLPLTFRLSGRTAQLAVQIPQGSWPARARLSNSSAAAMSAAAGSLAICTQKG
jgi:hypothetical protein